MLTLVESTADKKSAQRALERNLRSSLKRQGTHNIGHPGGNFDDEVYSNGAGTLWAALGKTFEENAITRYWNGFGVFDPDRRRQEIAVEINIPAESNTAQIAGFFARDTGTGDTFLLHSGKVGGGRPGIGKSAFLVHSKATLVDIDPGSKRHRLGVLIGKVNAPDLSSRIWRYVKQVQRFKDQAASGKLATAEFARQIAEFDRYSREFSGKKSGTRGGSFEYVTYHGDVVDALYDERVARRLPNEEVFNSLLMDLFVRKAGKLTEVYEVKTSTERQTLYTAIGQLLTHGIDRAVAKFLVLPEDEEVPDDLKIAIRALNINVRRFKLVGRPRKRAVRLD
jgi:hypothetical protein